MKREIKFKAVDLNGELRIGHYTEGSPIYHYITNNNGDVWQVDPDTIKEYSGINSISGDEVYEGALINCIGTVNEESVHGVVVVFENGAFRENYNGYPIYDFEYLEIVKP